MTGGGWNVDTETDGSVLPRQGSRYVTSYLGHLDVDLDLKLRTFDLSNTKLMCCRGGELGVLRVREHPLSIQVHPLTTQSTLSK